MRKISYLYFIKRNFNYYYTYLIIIIFFFAFENAVAKDVKIKKYCDFSYTNLLEEKKFLTKSDNKFKSIINKLNKSEKLKDFNILVVSNYSPRPGYEMEILKIKQTKKKIVIYFDVEKKSPSMLTVITYPYCFLKIENFDKYEIKVKKRRLKFLPVGLF